MLLVDPPERPAPDEDPLERDALWQRLAELPRQQRAVLVLRYYEGRRPPLVRRRAGNTLAADPPQVASPDRPADWTDRPLP